MFSAYIMCCNIRDQYLDTNVRYSRSMDIPLSSFPLGSRADNCSYSIRELHIVLSGLQSAMAPNKADGVVSSVPPLTGSFV